MGTLPKALQAAGIGSALESACRPTHQEVPRLGGAERTESFRSVREFGVGAMNPRTGKI